MAVIGAVNDSQRFYRLTAAAAIFSGALFSLCFFKYLLWHEY
jgi:hypothetical protein